MLFGIPVAAALFWSALPCRAGTDALARSFEVPVEAYQLGLIKRDDVVDVMITSREDPVGGLKTSCYAQVARVLSVSTAPHGMASLSTDSGLSPFEAKKALARHGRVRLLLRGAGDRLHNTHLGILSPEALADYARKGVPMNDLLAAATATSLDSLDLKKLPDGATVSGAHIPYDWRGFPLRLAQKQSAPKPGENVDVTVSYSGGPIKTVSLWKKVPVLEVERQGLKSQRDVVWLALPAGAARVLTYALDGLSPQGVTLSRSSD